MIFLKVGATGDMTYSQAVRDAHALSVRIGMAVRIEFRENEHVLLTPSSDPEEEIRFLHDLLNGRYPPGLRKEDRA